MRNSTSIRFAAAATLLIISCFGMLAHSFMGALACLLPVSFLIPGDAPDLSDSAMRRWLWGVGIRLAVLLVVVGIVYFHPLLTADTAQRILFHPAFILPVWLLALWSLVWCWRKQKGMVGA